MAEETALCADWLHDTLAADTSGAGSLGVLSTGITSRIYDSLADQAQTTYPIILFNMQAAIGDLILVGARRVWSEYLFQVKAVGKNHTYDQLSVIASRIDALIDRGSGTPTGGTIITCIRERSVRYAEPVTDGVINRHLGGLYHLIVQAT